MGFLDHCYQDERWPAEQLQIKYMVLLQQPVRYLSGSGSLLLQARKSATTRKRLIAAESVYAFTCRKSRRKIPYPTLKIAFCCYCIRG